MAQPTTGDNIAPAHAHDGEEFVTPEDPEPIVTPAGSAEALDGGEGLAPAIERGEHTKDAIDAQAEEAAEATGDATAVADGVTEGPADA